MPDALAAIELLEHESAVDRHRIFVLGHSQGGTYAPLIAKRAPHVAGVILLAAGAGPIGALIVRQTRHVASLPIGAQARTQLRLPQIERLAREIDSAAALEKINPRTNVMVGISGGFQNRLPCKQAGSSSSEAENL